MKRFYPKVSIVIPVYNGSDYLMEAVDSALAQTYNNIEIIIVNDGSTDGGATEKIAKSYGSKVRYYYKTNGGVGSAINFGIKKMTGKYFSWLSHDDLYLPNKIETQIEYLQSATRKDIILYSDYEIINENKQHIASNRLKDIVHKNDNFDFYAVLFNTVNVCTLLIPVECFSVVGLFNEKLLTSQDYELLIRLSEHYPLVHVPIELVKQRFHSKQGTKTIGTYNHERDSLFIDYINGISADRILELNKSIPSFYIAVAIGFITINKFKIISRHAFRLFLSNMFKSNPAELFGNLMLLVYYQLRYHISDSNYQRIRKAYSHLKDPRRWGELLYKIFKVAKNALG